MITPQYLKTNDMAAYLGYSGDFLLKNRQILFFKDVHYFPKDKRTNWKVSEMVAWVENKNMTQQVKNILDWVS